MSDDAAKKARDDGQKALADMHQADTVEGIFGAFLVLSEAVGKLAKEVAVEKRERRLAKRRLRYAIRKQQGIKPKAKPAPEPEPEYERATACYCSTCSHPPCGWCEGGGNCVHCGEPLNGDGHDVGGDEMACGECFAATETANA